MTSPADSALQKIQFYVTAPYACGYLPTKLAQSLIATPQHLVDSHQYSGLIKQGFRRSGKFVYRPHCENCNACTPVRLPVADFQSSRSQKRAYKQHQNLDARVSKLTFDEAHFELYKAYQIARHEGNEQEETAEQYRNFLVQSNVDSLFISFTLDSALKIVSVIDIIEDGISAVYTFYDSKDTKASYGTYSIMWLIDWCKELQLPYLYLGYLIKDSRKMVYKKKFGPQEALIDGEWQKIKHN